MPLSAIAFETKQSPARHPSQLPQQPIATLTNITKRYGTTVALDGLSLSLHPGEVVASTRPQRRGQIHRGQAAPRPHRPHLRHHASLRQRSSQSHHPHPRRRHAAGGPRHRNAPRPRAPRPLSQLLSPTRSPSPEILRIAQLQGIEDRFFGQLSGGQKQRVLFALAICGNPDLIFLDEPTVGMDIEARRALWQQIRSLSAQGKTVLLTTHYLEEADALAHRIIVINKGRVISEGTPAEIKRNSGGRTIRCQTRLSREFLHALPSVTNVEFNQGAVVVTASDAETVVREMLLRDETLSGLEVASPALEDAFLALTKNQ